MKPYDHKDIEKKWQRIWDEQGIYKTQENSDKPKQFVLDMFPYPSGEGLHVGHPRGYMATDVYSRMKRMQGFNVLHPMGWDAFGLPAENYAIKNKIHPRVAVEENIARFKKQLGLMGVDYDWSREINTTDPAFYKWTQWIFLQMYKKGLAYESFEPINWCPGCQTGLANEDVESDGTCERCGSKVEKKPMRQWVLKITDYADRMLADLDKLPKWPDGVKEAQRNWIGRKEGVVITHKVEDSEITLDAFSAFPAWLFADTYLVLAPEHPLVLELIKGTEINQEVLDFITEVKKTPEIERGAANKEKKGIFTGRYAIDPINQGEKMPIWIANFAMMGFGTGIIRCSSHDIRDLDFAKKYNIPLKEVVERVGENPVDAHANNGVLINSGPFTGKNITPELIKEMVEYFISQGFAKRQVTYRLKDWVFSRQRYWGEPIPIIHCKKCGVVPVPEKDLPVTLPEVNSYAPTGTGESPLANIVEWVNVACPACGDPAQRETNTMPQWAGSSWYYLRYIDPKNNESLIDSDKEKQWMDVDVYVGGDHATRHLIYVRFWHKFLYDNGIVSTEEPFPRLEFLGFILSHDGSKMSKSKGNVISPDDVIAQFGADAFRLYQMFIGPFEQTASWNVNGMVGTLRFVERIWRISEKVSEEASSLEVQKTLNKTIKKVGEDIEGFKFNTAVSASMILANIIESADKISRDDFKKFLQILAPFVPHVSEELWNMLGETGSIHVTSWPVYDENLVVDDSVTMGIQVNGKVRAEITIPVDVSEEAVRAQVLAIPEIQKWMEGREPKKFIYIPKKIISIVV